MHIHPKGNLSRAASQLITACVTSLLRARNCGQLAARCRSCSHFRFPAPARCRARKQSPKGARTKIDADGETLVSDRGTRRNGGGVDRPSASAVDAHYRPSPPRAFSPRYVMYTVPFLPARLDVCVCERQPCKSGKERAAPFASPVSRRDAFGLRCRLRCAA